MAKKIRRLIGAMFIITAIIFTQIPPRMAQAASVAKENFLLDEDTLSEYTGTATTVSVSDDIKVIGEEAFANNPYLGVINIGKNVKEIRHGAFANCTYLGRVIIPDNVTSIGSAAFSGCTGLKNVSIGAGVEEIGDGVFAGCRNLAGISVSRKNNNLKYEAGVLYDDTKAWLYTYLSGNQFPAYQMPNSVEHISPYSFWGNENVSEVYLSSRLCEVPAYAFSNCKNLKSIQIPYSVNYIDAKAFENCVNLGDVEIPGSVTYISPTAFDGCPKLNIIADPGTVAYDFFQNYDKSDIGSAESQDATRIYNNVNDRYDENSDSGNGTGTGNGYSSPENVYSPSSGLIDASRDPSNVDWMPSVSPLLAEDDPSLFGKTVIVGGRAVFFINREMDVKQIERDDTPVSQIQNNDNEETGDNSNNDGVLYDTGKGGYLPKYTYIDNKIASQAFYASRNNDDFVIPNGTKEIGAFSFARSSIEELVIPNGVESIGYGAFYHCDNLKKVDIPSSVKYISGYAFDNTPFLYTYGIQLSSYPQYMIVGDGILLHCNCNDKAYIPDGVKMIASGCFAGNENLESVVIPDSCTLIDSDAFRGCKKLRSVTGARNVEKIGDRAFMNCPVDNFVLPKSLKSIGLRAFDFTDCYKPDNTKVIKIDCDTLPAVTADETSQRLSNEDYRKDALYNVLFAIVDDDVINSSVEGTVLDNDSLGFSGMAVALEKDDNGNETGNARVIINYIYSQDVLDNMPSTFVYEGKEYNISNLDTIKITDSPYKKVDASKTLKTLHNGNEDSAYKGLLSEDEKLSLLTIDDSTSAAEALNRAYSDLFGTTVNMDAYDIRLKDETGSVDIKKLGQSSLYVTVPLNVNGNVYHVITLDEDGQLEELKADVDQDKKAITFETKHLSYFGVYATGEDNLVLNVKDGKVVKNYRLDDSPDTGDKSFSIYYVYAILLLSLGLILIFAKKREVKA